MILVTGVTGTVGHQVARRLAAVRPGLPVRLLARNPADVAPVGPRAEIVRGDYADRASLRRALAGVRAAFLVTNQPAEPHDVRFIEAASAAGVEHVVKLSADAVADTTADDYLTERQRENEAQLRDSGLAWTFLRPRAFMSNTLSWAPGIRSAGTVAALYGDSPSATVDPRDVAAVAVRALTEPGHEGHAYALTGPRAVTAREQTRLLSDLLNRPLRFEELTREQAGRALAGRYPPLVAEALLRSAERQRAGRKAEVSAAVLAVTGRAPRSYRRWAGDHRADFAPPLPATV